MKIGETANFLGIRIYHFPKTWDFVFFSRWCFFMMHPHFWRGGMKMAIPIATSTPHLGKKKHGEPAIEVGLVPLGARRLTGRKGPLTKSPIHSRCGRVTRPRILSFEMETPFSHSDPGLFSRLPFPSYDGFRVLLRCCIEITYLYRPIETE